MAGGAGEKVSRPRPRRVDVNFEFESLDRLSQFVSNISRSGCFVRTRDPWPVGTRLNLRFTVLLEDLEIVEARGEVVRVSERPRGMGVKFIDLSVASRDVVDRIVTRVK